MAKNVKNETLDTITRALKYLRLNTELLVRPGISAQLESIGNMLTAIVKEDKANHTAKRATARLKKRLNKPPKDYSNASKATLRQTYHYYVSHGRPLPAALETQLAKTFPGYSLKQHRFTGSRAQKPQPVLDSETTPRIDKRRVAYKNATQNEAPQPFAPIELFTALNKSNNKYSLQRKNFKSLLRAADAPYELVFFDAKTKKAVVRKNCGEKVYKMYLINCKTYTVARETRTGGISEISFVPGTHDLYTYAANSKKTFAWAYTYGNAPEQQLILPTGRKIISADATPEHTVIIGMDGTAYTTPLITLPDMSKPIAPESSMILTPLATSNIAPQSAQQQVAPAKPTAPVTNKKSADDATSSHVVLNVSLKPVKVDMDTTYYDVYVNGQRIVKNNIVTSVETFLDDTILGVYGKRTDGKAPAAREIWQVFSTDLKERPDLAVNPYTNQSSYITNVVRGKNEIILTDNKRVKYILDLKRYKKRADGKVFHIKKENQK